MTVAKARKEEEEANSFFTVSLILATVTAIIVGAFFLVFRKEILGFFGAKNSPVLEAAMGYSHYIAMALPLFVFVNFLMAFVRNDQDPVLPAVATVLSGVFNIFGDVFFVFDFGLGMGAEGAGLATAIGQCLTVLILCIHFFKKSNNPRIGKTVGFLKQAIELLGIGLSSFLLDISMGILIVLFNNQINVLTNKDATILGVFGIICNMMTLVQSFSYAVGQASQPLLSEAFGKENTGRIKKIKKYGLVSSLAVGIFFFVLFMADPPFWSGFSSIRKPIRKQSVSGRNSSVFSSLLCPCFP